MSKQPRILLVRWPLVEDFPFQVVRVCNLADPLVGTWISLAQVKELCADPTIEVEMDICGLGK
jgi:hypothetical protein